MKVYYVHSADNIEQNRVKDQRIAELEEQLTSLLSKHEVETHGKMPV